jgi:hypothetical protein
MARARQAAVAHANSFLADPISSLGELDSLARKLPNFESTDEQLELFVNAILGDRQISGIGDAEIERLLTEMQLFSATVELARPTVAALASLSPMRARVLARDERVAELVTSWFSAVRFPLMANVASVGTVEMALSGFEFDDLKEFCEGDVRSLLRLSITDGRQHLVQLFNRLWSELHLPFKQNDADERLIDEIVAQREFTNGLLDNCALLGRMARAVDAFEVRDAQMCDWIIDRLLIGLYDPLDLPIILNRIDRLGEVTAAYPARLFGFISSPTDIRAIVDFSWRWNRRMSDAVDRLSRVLLQGIVCRFSLMSTMVFVQDVSMDIEAN